MLSSYTPALVCATPPDRTAKQVWRLSSSLKTALLNHHSRGFLSLCRLPLRHLWDDGDDMNNVDCGIVEADVNNVYSQSLRYTPLTNLRVDWSWMSQNFHQLRGNGPYLVKPEGARRSHGVGLPTTFPTIVPYSLLADNTEDVLASNDPYAISLHALYMTFFCPLEFYTALPPDVLRMPLFAPLHASIKRVLKLRGDDAITNTTDECSKYMYPHNAHAIQEHVRAAIPIVNAYYTDVTAPAPKKERVALTAIPERFWEPSLRWN